MLKIHADVFMSQEAIASQPDGGDSNRKCRKSQASVESAAAPVHGSGALYASAMTLESTGFSLRC